MIVTYKFNDAIRGDFASEIRKKWQELTSGTDNSQVKLVNNGTAIQMPGMSADSIDSMYKFIEEHAVIVDVTTQKEPGESRSPASGSSQRSR